MRDNDKAGGVGATDSRGVGVGNGKAHGGQGEKALKVSLKSCPSLWTKGDGDTLKQEDGALGILTFIFRLTARWQPSF